MSREFLVPFWHVWIDLGLYKNSDWRRGSSIGRCGSSIGRRGSSIGRRGSSTGRRGSSIGRRGSSMVAHQAVVLQSRVRIRRLPSPQLTANLLVGCHRGMALGSRLTSVRGNRGKNYEMNRWFAKNIQRKKNSDCLNFFC